MEMNSPVGPNALDESGVVGKPLDRVDGPLKVTGGARYAYETRQDNVLYGFVVEASIGKGRIKSIDTRAAERAPGVALVNESMACIAGARLKLVPLSPEPPAFVIGAVWKAKGIDGAAAQFVAASKEAIKTAGGER